MSFRFDKNQKTLFIKPELKTRENQKGFKEGDVLLNSLLAAFSGIEYPVTLNDLKPLTAEFYNQTLTLNTDIADVYGAANKLFIELTPTVRIEPPKKE